jgi:hypothetical protein
MGPTIAPITCNITKVKEHEPDVETTARGQDIPLLYLKTIRFKEVINFRSLCSVSVS